MRLLMLPGVSLVPPNLTGELLFRWLSTQPSRNRMMVAHVANAFRSGRKIIVASSFHDHLGVLALMLRRQILCKPRFLLRSTPPGDVTELFSHPLLFVTFDMEHHVPAGAADVVVCATPRESPSEVSRWLALNGKPPVLVSVNDHGAPLTQAWARAWLDEFKELPG